MQVIPARGLKLGGVVHLERLDVISCNAGNSREGFETRNLSSSVSGSFIVAMQVIPARGLRNDRRRTTDDGRRRVAGGSGQCSVDSG